MEIRWNGLLLCACVAEVALAGTVHHLNIVGAWSLEAWSCWVVFYISTTSNNSDLSIYYNINIINIICTDLISCKCCYPSYLPSKFHLVYYLICTLYLQYRVVLAAVLELYLELFICKMWLGYTTVCPV